MGNKHVKIGIQAASAILLGDVAVNVTGFKTGLMGLLTRVAGGYGGLVLSRKLVGGAAKAS